METLKSNESTQTTLDLWLANPVLAAAGQMECERLASSCPATVFPDGTELAGAQEPADHVTVLLAGQARVFHRSADGREALARLVEAPLLLGDAEVLGGVCWLENVAAVGEVLLAQIPAQAFCELLERSPRAMMALLRHLAASSCVRTRDGRHVFAMLEQRMANLLLTLAERHGQTCGDGTLLTPPLSLTDLARALGTIPRTVAKTVAGLTRKGIICRRRGGFALLRPDALEAAASSMRHGLFYQMGMSLECLEQEERRAELEVVVLRGPGSVAGLRCLVTEDMVIGWDDCCGLRLFDDLVSRRHCRIHRASSGWRYWVDDLASESGTLVDGKPVKRAVLRGGEEIQVGSTQLLVRVVHREQPAEPLPRAVAAG
jgi:CRP-like cAMP-binding protein